MASPTANTPNTPTTQIGNVITPVEFHLFPKLPKELRLDIWGLTIQLRVVEVVFARPIRGQPRPDDPIDIVHKYQSTIPVLLHVHRESRLEGLKYYQLSNPSPNAMNRFYFNPAVDILDTESDWSKWRFYLENNECGLMNRVQNMAIPLRSVARPPLGFADILSAHCPALKKVVMVMGTICIRVRGDPQDCCCRTKSLLEFAESNEEAKSALRPELGAQDIAGLNSQRSTWEHSEIPCPDIIGVPICFKTRRWNFLDHGVAADFVAATAFHGD